MVIVGHVQVQSSATRRKQIRRLLSCTLIVTKGRFCSGCNRDRSPIVSYPVGGFLVNPASCFSRSRRQIHNLFATPWQRCVSPFFYRRRSIHLCLTFEQIGALDQIGCRSDKFLFLGLVKVHIEETLFQRVFEVKIIGLIFLFQVLEVSPQKSSLRFEEQLRIVHSIHRFGPLTALTLTDHSLVSLLENFLDCSRILESLLV